ncbi:MAG: glycosyltransferase [Proteobacteria bacterium]|nr:glycosyltransferase [Pseudomonadota bacterium]
MIRSDLPISVIIPTRNGAKRIPSCLEALVAALSPQDEIVIVNDASTDETASQASRFPCRVINLTENIGAARARNVGAKHAKNEILFFTDDDVIVKPDTLAKLRNHYHNPEISGVVGILDSEIPFTNHASNVKNLWMRFTYLKCPKEKVGLFYTSIASIRKTVFQEVGGFDENYAGASLLEDTEFGQRVWQKGYHIRIDTALSVTHVKHYTWTSILKTDYDRARALTHMKLRKWGQDFYTSVPISFQLAIPVLLMSIAFLVLSLVTGLPFLWSSLPVFIFFALTFTWLQFLFQSRGIVFGLVGTLFHFIDSFVVGMGMISACLRHLAGKTY